MEMVNLSKVRQGEYLMRLPKNPETHVTESMVWVKGDYIRAKRKYSITKFDDANREILVKGNALVWTGFTF
jgi:hypothetical protein